MITGTHLRRFLALGGSILIAAISGMPSPAAQSNTPSFVPTGLQAKRAYFGQLPFERLDMALGQVNLAFDVLTLPGDAGMDLSIGYSYSTGGGWHFGLPNIPVRIPNPHPAPEGQSPPQPPGILMGDGSSRVAYPANGTVHTATEWWTQDFWHLSTVTRVLTLPNGWKGTYEAGYPSFGRLITLTDPFGNSLTPEWDDAPHGTRMKSITQTLAGHTRTVSFQYGQWFLPTAVTYTEGSISRTWAFSWDEGAINQAVRVRLRTVTPPAGPPWQFDYPAMTVKVTTPLGGSVEYKVKQISFDDLPYFVLDTRTTGGRDIQPGTWTFVFNYATHNGSVTGPPPTNRRVDFEHQWFHESARWAISKKTYFQAGIEVARLELDYSQRRIFGNLRDTVLDEERLYQGGKVYTRHYSYASDDADHRYSDYHRPIAIVESGDLSRTVSRTYDYDFSSSLGAFSTILTESVQVGNETRTSSFQHDYATGFRSQETRLGLTEDFGRDPGGNAVTVTDSLGHQTAIAYAWGVPGTVTTPSSSIQRQINPDGSVAWESRGGATTSFSYDGIGRTEVVTPPTGLPTITTYSADGSWFNVARGATWTRTTVDGYGRPIGTESSAGTKTVTQYDVEGRKVYESYPFSSNETGHVGDSFTYDELDRTVRVTHSDGTYLQRTYSGTQVTVEDEDHRITVQEWKAYGDPASVQLSSVTDALGKVWTYSYNALGKLTRVASPIGPDRIWVYNSNNQLESETHPESGTTRYTYRDDGLVSSKLTPLGELSYSYDGDHRLVGIDAEGTTEDVTIAYDAKGNRALAVQAGVASEFSYDPASRLTERRDHIDGRQFTTTFEDDDNDQLIALTYDLPGEFRTS